MDQAPPFAEFTLADGRALFVGPSITLEGMFNDGDFGSVELHLLGVAVEPRDAEASTRNDIVDADGRVLARQISVEEALRLAPEQSLAIIASVVNLVEDSLTYMRSLDGSREVRDVLARRYIAREAPRLATDVRDAKIRMARELRADLDGL